MENVFSNIVDKSVLQQALEKSFKALDAILVDHSGPFASNAIIGSKWRQTNDVDEFTKDGIKILRHLLVSEDPVARLAARIARFIGIAVDKRCHDGTTTSMLLCCRLALVAIKKMDTDLESPERYRWATELNGAFDMCLAYLETLKITEDDLYSRCVHEGVDTKIEDVRAAIAYHMAMISSKGDHDLSTKVSYVIRTCPKKIFGMFKDTPLAVETEERYILKKQESDIMVRATIGHHDHYNYRSDTQYLSENAVIFATGNQIVSSSMESAFLSAFISTEPRIRADMVEFGEKPGWEAFNEGKRNLIILSPLLNDPVLMGIINEYNYENPETTISWFNITVHDRMKASLNKTIHYMAGARLFPEVMATNPLLSLVGLTGPTVKVHFVGNVLTLNNLYEKDDEVYHPFSRDPEAFPPYTAFVKETEELIAFANENITNPSLDPDELSYLTSLYRSLTTQTIYDIEIGGSAHDQYANRTVYEDAIGAALSAVNEGVVLGGYANLSNFCERVSVNTEMIGQFSDVFFSIVQDSLRASVHKDHLTNQFNKLKAEGEGSRWGYIAADKHLYLTDRDASSYIGYYVMDAARLISFLKCEPNEPFLLQAFGGYHEQLRRCRDILPKLSNTTHLADMRIQDGADVK